ncbi:amidase [Porphyromonadaceae bacterium COT-184 OH4590]|nr:amidase [Porphyromonadaceae bacterium COT-184 OH4590]MDO4725810.1 CHAP domain-containing protein [Porphyromonadaceae bacterium]
MKIRYFTYIIITIAIVISIGILVFRKFNLNNNFYIGQPIDSLNGVIVYYNGGVDNVSGRNITTDNYNIGLQYQCVEFVKRYYYEYLNHKMPDSYGHAKDFFDHTVKDGQINSRRNLIQYTNPSATKPQIDDLLIFGAILSNRYGHVAIISNVTDNEIEIIQQNPGAFGKSRVKFDMKINGGQYYIDNKRILGWLRKE